jgi:hypothetical protein
LKVASLDPNPQFHKTHATRAPPHKESDVFHLREGLAPFPDVFLTEPAHFERVGGTDRVCFRRMFTDAAFNVASEFKAQPIEDSLEFFDWPA